MTLLPESAGAVIFTVSQISRSIRNLLEGEFCFVRVSGEISNLSRPYSGHSYFTLKDAGAQLRSVLFKGQQRYLAKELRDGQQVVCHGRISVYEPRGDYQLIVDSIDFHGAGLLQLQFEALKKRLADEGLFEAGRKKTLPKFPRKIVVVTSPSGAAIHDFLKIWKNRGWGARIQIFAVRVLGTGAAEEIAEAIVRVNAHFDAELIVLCRGGGSLEDLWAFNEECLARAIVASTIPIVSAIGHEVDFTIADFCADLRAPTPTGAAEQIFPDAFFWQQQVFSCKQQLIRLIFHTLDDYSRQVMQNRRLLGNLDMTLSHLSLQVDHASSRSMHCMERALQRQSFKLAQISARFQSQSPLTRLTLQAQQLHHISQTMIQRMQGLLYRKSATFSVHAARLESVSPLATLARGYAIVRKKKEGRKGDEIVMTSSQVNAGDQIEVLLHDGSLECDVSTVRTIRG